VAVTVEVMLAVTDLGVTTLKKQIGIWVDAEIWRAYREIKFFGIFRWRIFLRALVLILVSCKCYRFMVIKRALLRTRGWRAAVVGGT
jgi:hypothetical protein